MNVGELRKALDEMPDEMIVVVAGYEGGVTPLLEGRHVNLALNVHSEFYYGKHQVYEPGADAYYDKIYGEAEQRPAIYLIGDR